MIIFTLWVVFLRLSGHNTNNKRLTLENEGKPQVSAVYGEVPSLQT
jgi:hypothetical protein